MKAALNSTMRTNRTSTVWMRRLPLSPAPDAQKAGATDVEATAIAAAVIVDAALAAVATEDMVAGTEAVAAEDVNIKSRDAARRCSNRQKRCT